MKTLTLTILMISIFVASYVTAQEATQEPSALLLDERPLAQVTLFSQNATLKLYFKDLAQGQVGLIHVSGNGITKTTARLGEREIKFFSGSDGFYAFLVVPMDQSQGTFDLTVTTNFESGASETIAAAMRVVDGRFIRQDITLSDENNFLADTTLEATELEYLQTLFKESDQLPLWDKKGFVPPLTSQASSPFGVFRIFNGTSESRHTGWDMKAKAGTPVEAIANGNVVFAGMLDIRGNYVLIDHGGGVFSGYAHLSVIHVTQGQSVTSEQIIGLTGNTGRSKGAHFHWEIAVDGAWVDSFKFISMWIPQAVLTINDK